MKINQKILSIPPYISTSWKNIVSLHLDHRGGSPILMIGLVNGSNIEIPNLEQSVIENVFSSHERYIEQAPTAFKEPGGSPIPFPPGGGAATLFSFPLPLGDFGGEMGNILQHNPEASDSPDLPKDMLDKIASVTRSIGLDQAGELPKPEPHCNCMHCQIMRVLSKDSEEAEVIDFEEDEVTEDDLKFREWDIEQKEELLFYVSNPFNKEEHYNVFLGNPVGCTCGKPDCEHIHAVLNS